MRSRPLLLLLTLAAALAVGEADAATPGSKRPYIPPPSAADLGLRGPVAASTPAISLPLPQGFTTPLPMPGRALTGLASGGIGSTAVFTPLRSVGDQAPICRATCAETRVVCASTDDQNCDSAWSQCVADCSAPVLR